MAVADLRECQLSILGRDHAAALAAARAAAEARPSEAIAVLPSLDLARDEDLRAASTAPRRQTRGPGQRDALSAGAGLGLVLHGKPPGDVAGDDGALLAYLGTPSPAPAVRRHLKLAGDVHRTAASHHRPRPAAALPVRHGRAATPPPIRRTPPAPCCCSIPARAMPAGLRVLLLVLSSQPGAIPPNVLASQIAGA